MKRSLKRWVAVLVCASLFMVNAGCTKTADKNTEECLELVNSPSTTLDNVWYNPGGMFRCAIFESLVIANAQMTEVSAALAEDYEISEDGKSLTFQLREDVKWHDGEPFDSEDVVFSVKTALRSDEINGIFTALQYIEGAESYSAGESEELPGLKTEGNVVTFTLTEPLGGFLQVIAQFAILPEHLLGTIAPNELPQSDFWKKPVGCGCYVVTEAVAGEYFILEANKEYYGKAPGVSKIRIRLNEENCVQAMEEGRLDFYVTNDPEEIARMKGLSSCSSHSLNILFPAYFIFNTSGDEGVNEDLKDVRVRKALLLAIDRETMIEAIFPGSSITDTLVPAWDEQYCGMAEEFQYNPEQAKSLLEEAGFDFSRTLRLRYSVKGQATEDLMEAIAVYWRAVGIQVSVERFEGSGSKHMFETRDYDICYKRLSAFDHASIYEEVHSNSVMQTALYQQSVYDELLNQLKLTGDKEKRRELICQLQRVDQQYLLRLPLFALANIAYVNDTRFDMPEAYGNLWYRYDLRFEDWKLLEGSR